jgi:cytochrome c1
MERKGLLKGIGLILIGSFIGLTSIQAYASGRAMQPEELAGKNYFEGSKSFTNGGPSCISCHSVKNNNVATGGLLAKDLTDVYTRLGEGLSAWLAAPSFPAMAASYQNNPLTESERANLQAFLKYANDVKASQTVDKGYDFMLVGGVCGLASILILINILWFKRKKKMVKKEIFARQHSARDAKH